MTLRDMVNFLVDTLECTRSQAINIITRAENEGYVWCDCGKGDMCPQFGRIFNA